MSFFKLGVNPALVKVLKAGGILEPFPIQTATLPDAIAGRDVLGRGQTGSGKTLAFGLAMLTRLAGRQAKAHQPLALILAPTRELAMQINDTLRPLNQSLGLDSRLIAGGMPYGQQIQALRKAVPILVATPGRLMDLIKQREVRLSDVEIVILDEADQMVDMGFLPVVKEILDQTKPNGQRLLFSATLDGPVEQLVRKYLRNPVVHSVDSDKASVDTMDHHVLVIDPLDKDKITTQLAARDGRTILFVRTQHGADKLAKKLADRGVPVGSLHGGKSQAVRTRTLAAFKSGETNALVATDVAARGIHVDGISLVVHVDAPTDPKDYLHRAGRTARAGESGTVVTLTTSNQQKTVRGLTTRAGVNAAFVRVKPHAPELSSLFGAQEPSGTPWVAPVFADKSEGRRSGGGRPAGRSNTSGRPGASGGRPGGRPGQSGGKSRPRPESRRQRPR